VIVSVILNEPLIEESVNDISSDFLTLKVFLKRFFTVIVSGIEGLSFLTQSLIF